MHPCTFVIFGGTGDLARARLLPAIGSLLEKGRIHPSSLVVGVGRRDFTDASYMRFLLKNLRKPHRQKAVRKLPLRYFRADFSEKQLLQGLGAFLEKNERGRSCNRLYYLAVSYSLFDPIVSALRKSRLHRHPTCFRRIVFEKPFGHDLRSSNKIEKCIGRVFPEHDVYRIDHYLGKETVQNILMLRFANPLFERVWNRSFIDRVTVKVSEAKGVGTRFGYYDGTGASRDMLQNHLLQVASLVLMEPPKSIAPEPVHNAKVKILKTLRVHGRDDVVFGQYASYRREAREFGIRSTRTETYAAVRLHSTHPRWRGVPIVLRSGKRLARKIAVITIDFKKEPCMFYCSPFTRPNRLHIHIQPDKDIILKLYTKRPGDRFDPVRVSLNFCHDCEFGPSTWGSYERLLYDCMHGDKTLFTRFDELRESWRITDRIVGLRKSVPLRIYRDGSKGPHVPFKMDYYQKAR